MRIALIVVLLLSCFGIGYYFTSQEAEKPLPIINPVDVESEMVDRDLVRQGFGHTISDFSFKNQFNRTISLDNVKGKVFVAEYFFTTCGSICPRMTDQMLRIQAAFKSEKNVAILSFTVDPDVDTVEQMERYAKEHKIVHPNWHLLTGDKTKLYELARRSFFVLKPAEAKNQGDVGSDFIHTNNFVLVDQQQRIRGYYDGTNPHEVDELIGDMRQLLK